MQGLHLYWLWSAEKGQKYLVYHSFTKRRVAYGFSASSFTRRKVHCKHVLYGLYGLLHPRNREYFTHPFRWKLSCGLKVASCQNLLSFFAEKTPLLSCIGQAQREFEESTQNRQPHPSGYLRMSTRDLLLEGWGQVWPAASQYPTHLVSWFLRGWLCL